MSEGAWPVWARSAFGAGGLWAASLAVAPLAASIGMPDTTRLLAGLAIVYAAIWAIGVTRMGKARKHVEPEIAHEDTPDLTH
ncbi:hypothetical protein [Streptomyces canus]|uniref:hypothetical protein n=1 Tax=Streptomyces canus TaxID=58343 RepID=UPI00036401FB|nr:hypothetical protein [Streptomyces canus]